ncbi:MAG: hypothetical protein IJX27_07065, partial [Clostridia bacterium]|nr:hypothetical protein [Clostridia bacterium]
TTVNNLTMGLLDGIAEDVKFYVPADSYDTYVANYFWSPYAFIIYPEISEPGGTTPEDPPQADENEKYFVFAERKVGGELKGYNIIGLSELGKSQEVLTTPKVYNGMRVYNLKANAFSGAAATEIYITDTIASIEDGAFAGAQSLKKVHILAENPDSTTVNNLSMGLCDGMAKDAKFYVPAASYSSYVSNYFWSPYASKITSE